MSKTNQPITLGNFRALSHQSARSTSSIGSNKNIPTTNNNQSKQTKAANGKGHSKSIAVANEILGNNKPLAERSGTANLNNNHQAGAINANSTVKSDVNGATLGNMRTLVWNNQTVDKDIKRCYNCNPDVAADAEAEYYENVRRLDECGHCWANTQKYYTGPFKLRQKGPADSIYQRDFIKHPIEKPVKITNDFWGTFDIDEPRDFGTTMAKDYVPHKVQPIKKETMVGKSSVTGVPFAGRSGYKTEFINWGNMPVNIEKPPVNISVIPEISFMGKTAYREVFVPQDGKPARPVERDLYGTKRSPLSPGIPFMGVSTHNSTYQPHALNQMPNFPIKDEFDATETYPNQFKTLYQKDYPSHGAYKCPAKIYMETHPHPKAAILKP